MVAVDAWLIEIAVVAAMSLRLQGRQILLITVGGLHHLLVLALITGLPVLLFSGWYRGLTRYAGSYSLYGLLPRSALMVLLLLLVNTTLGLA